MQRLSQEGLLVSFRNRGVFVVELGAPDVTEIYGARAAIEIGAARTVRERGTAAALSHELTSVVDSMQVFIDEGDWRGLAERDLAFHTALVGATGNSRMARMFATLAAEARICMASLRTAYHRPEALIEEHRLLVDLLVTGEWQEVEAAFTEHMTSAVHDLTRSMMDETSSDTA